MLFCMLQIRLKIANTGPAERNLEGGGGDKVFFALRCTNTFRGERIRAESSSPRS